MAHHLQTEINKRLRRAVKNNARLHLELEMARHLMDPRIYAVFAEIEAEEARRKWQTTESQDEDEGPTAPDPSPPENPAPRKPRPANDSSSAPSTSGTGKTGTTGISSGLMEVAGRAARRQVLAVGEEIRRKQREKRSLTIGQFGKQAQTP